LFFYLLALAFIVVSAALAFGISALLHLQGTFYLLFVVILLLLGVSVAIFVIVLHVRSKKQQYESGDLPDNATTGDLDLLLNDAKRKLRNSQQAARALEAMPLIYIIGEAGSAKTTTVLKSGLDLELLAGTAPGEGSQVPTEVVNLWITPGAALLEVGSRVRQNSGLLSRLVEHTRTKAFSSAFGKGAAPRACIVCVDASQLLVADGGVSLLASARTTGGQLREMSRLLGMPLPVYVIVTKLDRVAHFEEYVRNLSDDEVRQVFGAALPANDATPGTYADEASRTLVLLLDRLCYQLGEFRIEMLVRENDPHNLAGVYEFPRELAKLRKYFNQYLVELCKPSQLSANPYLRGFYFIGIRARTVERMAAAPVIVLERAILQDPGATQYLKLPMERHQSEIHASTPAQMVSSRVAQWNFLPRLFSETIVGDKSALSATKQTAQARLFRRILYGSLSTILAVYIVFLAVSYIHNLGLERRIANAAKTLPLLATDAISLPSLSDLRSLDELRQVIVQLDGYRSDGPPWSYRFGLYQGDELATRARHIYFDRFRPMLLNPAQTNLVRFMRSLPDAPAANSDFSSYISAYDPLEAYLITTSNPDKSQTKFLTPVLLQYWIGNRQIDADQQQLTQKQIDFYGGELLRQPPYSILSDSTVVEHARGYLSKFVAVTRIYQGMLTDADNASPSIDFNKRYPGSAAYVVDGHIVRGAFTRDGYASMQDALQHPGRYAQGETWVLGQQVGQSLNEASVSKELTNQYSADYLKEWHTFLSNAKVVSCGNLHEAPGRLNNLAGPASPLLALFYTVSHNTAVADPQIKAMFQPTQALVDPNAADRLIGPGNNGYVTALLQLAAAVDLVEKNPAAASDPTAFAPVLQASSTAGIAAQQAAQSFNVDQKMHTENTVLALMQAPVQCAAKLVPSPGAAANGAGQKICGAVTPLLGKSPFAATSNVPASLAEVDATFAPETGALWSIYNTSLKPYLVPRGPVYVSNPSSPQPVNPNFVLYFNRAARISSDLYPPGQKSASFSFTLRFIPGNGVASATLVVDGQRIPAGATSQQFKWSAIDAQKASLIYDSNEVLPYQGMWSLFQLVHIAQITRTATGVRLDYRIDTATTIAGHTVGGTSGPAKTASFELSGPGAEILLPEFFRGLQCALPVVK